jgi:serine/threonine protein kinase
LQIILDEDDLDDDEDTTPTYLPIHCSQVGYFGSYFLKDNDLRILMEYCAGGSVRDIMTILGKGLVEEEIAVVLHYVLNFLTHLHSSSRILSVI